MRQGLCTNWENRQSDIQFNNYIAVQEILMRATCGTRIIMMTDMIQLHVSQKPPIETAVVQNTRETRLQYTCCKNGRDNVLGILLCFCGKTIESCHVWENERRQNLFKMWEWILYTTKHNTRVLIMSAVCQVRGSLWRHTQHTHTFSWYVYKQTRHGD